MRRAIALSEESVKQGGGPFGAVIAKMARLSPKHQQRDFGHRPHGSCRGELHSQGDKEIRYIRPCGMWYLYQLRAMSDVSGAIYWAHLDKIYYANDRNDAAKIGFDDDFIYMRDRSETRRPPQTDGNPLLKRLSVPSRCGMQTQKNRILRYDIGFYSQLLVNNNKYRYGFKAYL